MLPAHHADVRAFRRRVGAAYGVGEEAAAAIIGTSKLRLRTAACTARCWCTGTDDSNEYGRRLRRLDGNLGQSPASVGRARSGGGENALQPQHLKVMSAA